MTGNLADSNRRPLQFYCEHAPLPLTFFLTTFCTRAAVFSAPGFSCCARFSCGGAFFRPDRGGPRASALPLAHSRGFFPKSRHVSFFSLIAEPPLPRLRPPPSVVPPWTISNPVSRPPPILDRGAAAESPPSLACVRRRASSLPGRAPNPHPDRRQTRLVSARRPPPSRLVAAPSVGTSNAAQTEAAPSIGAGAPRPRILTCRGKPYLPLVSGGRKP